MVAKGARLSVFALPLAVLPAVPTYGSESSMGLEEVVVTAQRRPENQLDVPIAVSAISGDELAARRVRTLEGLSAVTPGLTATDTVSYSAAPISIRGIGGANGGGNFFNDEPVAVYVDGVYVSRLSASTTDLLDIESIQVLRGPQGTLYGRNSTAGAILVTTNAPSSELSAGVRASVARFGDIRTQGFVSGPLSDSVSARASVGVSSRDGYGTNRVDGQDVGGGDDRSARLSMRYQPGDHFSFLLSADYQDRDVTPALIAMTDVGDTGVASPFVQRSDLSEVLDSREFALNDVNATDSETWSLTANTAWNFGQVVLEMITGFRDWSLRGQQDSDSTALQLFTNRGAIDSRQFSHEIRLASNDAGRLAWTVGGIVLRDQSEVEFSIQNFQGLFGLGTNAAFNADQDTDAYALFADVTYDLTDRLSLTAGGRLSYERKDFENNLVVSVLNGGTAPPFFLDGAELPAGTVFSAPPTFADEESFTDFSPRVIVDYRLGDHSLLFANYSQGFKSGGFNSFGLTPAFDAEDLDAFEVGIKTESSDKRFRLSASGFIYRYSDLQIRLPVPTGGVDIQNVAEADIMGVELEGSAVLAEGLTLTASLGFLDTEITEGVSPSIATSIAPFPIGAPLPLTLEDVSGNRLTRAPDYQGAVTATYQRPLGRLIGTLSLDYRFQDDVFFLETNQDATTFRNRSWEELSLRTSVTHPNQRWTLSVFVRNLFDNRRVTAVTALGGFPNAALNEPRQWGLEVDWRFF